MLTRCPNPTCLKEFAKSGSSISGEASWIRGKCDYCGQPATFRPLELVRELERLSQIYGEETLFDDQAMRFTAVIEDVRSLWNVGSIFRSSDGAGIDKLFLCGITGRPPRKEISKTSLGAETAVPWQYKENVLNVLPELKRRSFLLLGLERTPRSRSLNSALVKGLLSFPLCLVVGNEVTGLSEEALACCDLVCHLPMRGVKESLNVAVAFGIASYRIADLLFAAEETALSSLEDQSLIKVTS